MEALIYTANINSLIPSSSSSSSSSSGAGGGSSCWGHTSAWTKEENKRFERALALFDETTPDRWTRVAEMLPGKSVWEVMKQYQVLEEDVSVIEAGLDDYDDDDDDDSRRKKKKPPLAPAASSLSWSSWTGGQNDRRKGVPWTEEEHRRFLVGLSKHGKGDWRSISRKFVMSKTPTQVASHAQKYFLRQMSVAKDKKRPSIHDITTANLAVLMPPPPPSITVHLV